MSFIYVNNNHKNNFFFFKYIYIYLQNDITKLSNFVNNVEEELKNINLEDEMDQDVPDEFLGNIFNIFNNKGFIFCIIYYLLFIFSHSYIINYFILIILNQIHYYTL